MNFVHQFFKMSSRDATTGPLVKRMPWEMDRSKGNKIPPKPTPTSTQAQPITRTNEPSRFVTTNQQYQQSSIPSTATRKPVNNPPPSNPRKPEIQNNLREPTITTNSRPQSSYASDEPAAPAEIRKPSLSLLKSKQATGLKK